MPFSLPLDFGERGTELGRRIITMESTPDSATQDQALTEALGIACGMLQAIDSGFVQEPGFGMNAG